jgi:uncharacterized protein
MSDLNSKHNRVVWVDIPVADLDRSAKFYSEVLNIKVDQETFGDFKFGILQHEEGNGGCLVLNKAEVTASSGILVYLNVHGRIKDAAAKVEKLGGKIVEPIHPIGPHGFRAIIIDSEGNRVALHSHVDG